MAMGLGAQLLNLSTVKEATPKRTEKKYFIAESFLCRSMLPKPLESNFAMKVICILQHFKKQNKHFFIT